MGEEQEVLLSAPDWGTVQACLMRPLAIPEAESRERFVLPPVFIPHQARTIEPRTQIWAAAVIFINALDMPRQLASFAASAAYVVL